MSIPSFSDWQVAWGPGLNNNRSNMLYVAGNAMTNQYAVVVRGTDWTFVVDWLEDLASMLAIVPFAPANDNDVQIAWGTGWARAADARSTVQRIVRIFIGANHLQISVVVKKKTTLIYG